MSFCLLSVEKRYVRTDGEHPAAACPSAAACAGARALAAASERYRRLKIWKSTPVIDAKPIEKFQDILVEGHVLDPARRVKYQDLILPEFAAKAK